MKNSGTAFKLKAPAVAGGAWVLHDFAASSLVDGYTPRSELILRNGWFYGVALQGGESGYWGAVHSLIP